jgi:hypothetical protein
MAAAAAARAPLADELAALNSHRPALSRYRDINAPLTLLLGELNEGKSPTARMPSPRHCPKPGSFACPARGHLAHTEAPDVLAKHLHRRDHHSAITAEPRCSTASSVTCATAALPGTGQSPS